MTLVIGIVAGEPSGDALGASLMAAIRRRVPNVAFTGVGGTGMLEQGLAPIAALAELSVNGFIDPVKRFPALLGILRRLERNFTRPPADLVIGVDFNVFNLLLERRVKRRGVPTAHYVSPAVYAWRRGRIKRIGRAADVVLALFPFEPALYAAQGARATFVGHPLADEIALDAGSEEARRSARETLGIAADLEVVTLMPGSRLSEIEYLGDIFLAAAEIMAGELERPLFVVPCVNHEVHGRMAEKLRRRAGSAPVRLIEGDARALLTASNAALVKSGTGTLEAMLLRRPMVVSYKLGKLTYHIVKLLIRSEFVALPNILAGRRLVPELLQDAAEPRALAFALLAEWRRADVEPHYFAEFEALHGTLRQNASERAADAALALIGR